MFFVKKPRLPLFLSISYFWFTYETSVTVLQQIGKVHDHQYRALLCTFIRNLSYFPQSVLQHATDYFQIFSGFFEDIPQNVWRHSPECLRSFPGVFGDIPRNVWEHSPEYNIPPIPRVPRIPFPVPVFLVLYIAHLPVLIN